MMTTGCVTQTVCASILIISLLVRQASSDGSAQHGAPVIRSYSGINVEISRDVPREQCQDILTALETTLTTASKVLYEALNGSYYFRDFNIHLPASWPDKCIPQAEANETHLGGHEHPMASPVASGSTGGHIDLVVTDTSAGFGERSMWTQQSGQCGMPGQMMHAPYESLLQPHSGYAFVRTWAKYRYGVFDEVGYGEDKVYAACYKADGVLHMTTCSSHELDQHNVDKYCKRPGVAPEASAQLLNPLARTSLMAAQQGARIGHFCDSGSHNRYAPTRHNYMCDRHSTLDVILAHADFGATFDAKTHTEEATGNNWSAPPNMRPLFNYRRHRVARFAVIVEDSLDMAVRESWSFLRSAFRKWVLYDLLANSEVGVVLARGRNMNKTLDIMPLSNATNRDLVASFLPYTPTDTRQPICMECAVNRALALLDKQRSAHGNAAHYILIVAPGMDRATNVLQITERVRRRTNPARLVTLNYPRLALQADRMPLDALTEEHSELSFSVEELKYNSEKSFLTSYVRLTTVLLHIARVCHEPADDYARAPVEIHRNLLTDSSDYRVHGDFYLDTDFGQPAGFYIYTHAVETPLIQNMRLISPSGRTYQQRSDQRMPVKQLTLLAALNETGSWHYEIERYPGHPQPHVVQVLATPHYHALPVLANSWIVRHADCFLLYTQVTRGVHPVLGVSATVSIEYTESDPTNSSSNSNNNNSTPTQRVLPLHDDGTGDIDTIGNDGIYSGKLRVPGVGIYNFEFITHGVAQPQQQQSQLQPFTRVSPLLTHYVTPLDLSQAIAPAYVLNFICDAVGATHLNFTWTLNVADALISGYEIRYALSLQQIVDYFDHAQVLMATSVQALGARADRNQQHLHEVADTPSLYGQTVYFALRPKYAQPVTKSPISNIAQVVVVGAPVVVSPEHANTHTNTTQTDPAYSHVPAHDGDKETPATTTTAKNATGTVSTAVLGKSQMGLLPYALASCLALLLVLAVIVCCCFIKKKCHCRRKDAALKATTKANLPTQTSANQQDDANVTDNSDTSNYGVEALRLQNHHTIGIPLSAEHEAQVPKRQAQDYSNGFYTGINNISSTLDRCSCSDGQNWTAATYQLSDNQPHLTMDDASPPVPPLPFAPPHAYDYLLYRLPSPQLPEEYQPIPNAHYSSSSDACKRPDDYATLSHTANTVLEVRRSRNVTIV